MNTYTIALLDDLLIATVPDGQDIDIAIQDELVESGMADNYGVDDCKVYKGLVLSQDEPESGEVIYSGTDCGRLLDEHGTTYGYAYRA